jgi:hypothetical protein
MPKEKIIFLIGVWIAVLSHFVGLPTEIKNYLFVGTGVLLILISYGYLFARVKGEEKMIRSEPKVKIPKTETKIEARPRPKIKEISIGEELIDFKSAPSYEDKTPYEPVVRTRKARIKAVPKFVSEEIKTPAQHDSFEEEDDVVVISGNEK